MKQTLTILDFGSGEVHQYHDLNYDKYFSKGQIKLSNSSDYTSLNTNQLTIEELEKKILKI